MTCHNIAITDVASMLYAMSSSDEFPKKVAILTFQTYGFMYTTFIDSYSVIKFKL